MNSYFAENKACDLRNQWHDRDLFVVLFKLQLK